MTATEPVPDAPPPAAGPPRSRAGRRGPMRRLYDWILELARRPTAERALGLLSFAESMFFPIPPDVMLIPMCVAEPRKALRFASIASVFSLLGGIGGYALGHFLWQAVDDWFFAWVPGFSHAGFDNVAGLYERWNFWVVFTAGFTPIPYKLITISAGVFAIAFPVFVAASAVSRSARFFLVAALLRRYGAQAQDVIERHFNVVATLFVVLLVLGFWVVGRL